MNGLLEAINEYQESIHLSRGCFRGKRGDNRTDPRDMSMNLCFRETTLLICISSTTPFTLVAEQNYITLSLFCWTYKNRAQDELDIKEAESGAV